MILAALVLIAALAVASYELWRRRASAGDAPPETGDPPPLIYGQDDQDADGGDADGGD